ncbi:hypothetical protein PV336_36110 [Streptomyces sp. MI02-2A]|uniref:hypothetical protein n=1 Tax=unclassified Streptomyces TaxID=2593676 RepID=UPI000A8B06D5|nr:MULTISPECIES: hypothetical protein [unclassified Streptomyces]MDX3264569.1 hypothetical protein [Streptomyces sp. MI02-2A]REE61792.1 hypothetical protein BX257_4379 [Streptomyces sp. 3212.3]
MSTGLRLTWTLTGHGWADCTIEAPAAKAELTASHIGNAPEDLLNAVTRLMAGASEARVQFEAEPTAFRWFFHREGDDVWLRLLELRHGGEHDNAGTQLWSGALSIDGLARAVVRCFDEVALVHGESGYRGKWGEHFPRSELEALRHTWRAHRSPEIR